MDLSGYAAWAAAATSMATLVVTTLIGGRREQRKWARGALADAFVAFLEASWAHSDLIRACDRDLEKDPADIERAYSDMRSQLTRLRLLASQQFLPVGEELLRVQRELQQSETGDPRTAALERAAKQRRAVVQAAKLEMGL